MFTCVYLQMLCVKKYCYCILTRLPTCHRRIIVFKGHQSKTVLRYVSNTLSLSGGCIATISPVLCPIIKRSAALVRMMSRILEMYGLLSGMTSQRIGNEMP